VTTTHDDAAATDLARSADRTTALALAAAGVTVVLWASAFVAIRHVGQEISPGPLTLGRLLVGSLVLGTVVMVRGPQWPARRDWRLLLVCGLLWFGVYNIALNAAEQRVDAGTTAMLVNVGPLILALLAGVLLGEGFPPRLVVGSLIAFGGVAIIGAATSGRSAGTTGVLLCLVAAVGYAVGVVAQKPLLGRLPALEVTWLACTVGAVACLPFAPGLVSEAADARVSTLAWIGYLGAFPTAVAFTTWAFALSHTTAGRMGATTFLVPPVAILLAWLLLDESPEPLAFAGGALCLLGVAVARRTRKPPGGSGAPS
jgi:drug/metabolite transporter (DMT)-like permease